MASFVLNEETRCACGRDRRTADLPRISPHHPGMHPGMQVLYMRELHPLAQLQDGKGNHRIEKITLLCSVEDAYCVCNARTPFKLSGTTPERILQDIVGLCHCSLTPVAMYGEQFSCSSCNAFPLPHPSHSGGSAKYRHGDYYCESGGTTTAGKKAIARLLDGRSHGEAADPFPV